MLMEHFLCADVGGKRNVCGMDYPYLKVSTAFLVLFSIPFFE
ncbi:hypothetical protein SAMN04488514_12610 [Kriegella aquimaris]|uniref:Uncharacterized protein n=1 Tax=Kriegella aquimaris TaxID=192904 RepID=A0A1G9YT38_9FLAO|nr:hypothetical protein SAMN04488514_12610 [Kriegella aquimaris]